MEITIAPTNLKKLERAIDDISSSIGLLQTCGIPFQVVYPIVVKGMEVLNALSIMKSELTVVESGRGRSRSQGEPTPLTTEEVAQLEAEVEAVQALAPPANEVPERKLSHFEQLHQSKGIESPGQAVE